jgi:hypothetical protein
MQFLKGDEVVVPLALMRISASTIPTRTPLVVLAAHALTARALAPTETVVTRLVGVAFPAVDVALGARHDLCASGRRGPWFLVGRGR